MKKVYIIHGWGGSPEEPMLKWLADELKKGGFEVVAPAMPNTDEPKIETWVPFLENVVGIPDENTFFVGHSIGCQAILRFLETLPTETRVGGVVYVAGWLTLKGLDDYDEEDKQAALPWLETPIDLGKVRNVSPKSVAIFTKDDPFVDVGNAKFYEEKLGSKIIILETGGHLNDESNTKQLPSALEAIKEISNCTTPGQ
ncbi:MAG: hypothetical protein A3J09_00730 [Candidatus Zambryskibacteria bacterium RIFCSPLOWO2_02_FULL_51_21]|uniref:Serine hydrolase family protein n=1 Tax=Candidatus Zambryskibacteria bacterium RIFCSPHIGHO2_02_FULL_43_37 TaxID=1802749 RepID=A0A1G2THF0_9BACT|nr:MAG: hypothetical protein A2723_00725 [Candidatus Zambryskibacteria bacterium RIFCSPHIGHO2_01_FULL_52_18]OHA96726.1 MAG: hypothetical protein A3D49_02690 [Candidatus Zambryskibacteria bacterium RIFCSPHIGHO2_02_FULL_43_37]OHB07419.1 MAG: hypothetical protein A2944_01765 [Candidatus Zambryskibacteria bacterium RIFCSPLOWO2_01_FULL_52_12]OHB11081.1 MAG: hypothetical protein A3J09_00730 [Candidatus Zambryskibacteria bacterium RIFCSPLOWO2_02_FULL_51_21]